MLKIEIQGYGIQVLNTLSQQRSFTRRFCLDTCEQLGNKINYKLEEFKRCKTYEKISTYIEHEASA